MNTSMEHISDFAVYLFFAVALNSDWSANSFLWWGSIAFLIGAYVVSKGFVAYYDLLPNLLILFFAKALVLFGEKGDKI